MKRWLALCCAAVMLLALCPAAALPVGAGTVLVHRTETTLMEQIIARDGCLEGIWFPWFGHDNLGHGLTSNEVMVEYVGNQWATVGIDEYGTDSIYREIYNLKSLGFNILGYEGSIYGEGVIFDATGDVVGIKEEYLYNVRRFLDICRAVDMPVLWTICCHSTTLNEYYAHGKMAWDRICRCYADPTVADHYAERFVKPLAAVLAEYPDVVALVASTSEAENEINDSQVGNHFDSRELYGVSQENMLYFINAVTEAVKAAFPAVPRTLCCQLEDMSLYSEVDFDLLGDQNYNSAGNSRAIEHFRSPVPMIVSEFGLGFEKNYDDEYFWKMQRTFRDNFRADGYQGWMMWCWSTDRDQPKSSYSWLNSLGSRLTDFRPAAYELHDYIAENRAAHRGETVALDTPVLFCNTGDGVVEWIAPRQATAMDLLRSDDGGKTWKKELDNVNPSRYVTGRKGKYITATAPTADTVYRVVTRDGKGNETASQVSNRAAEAKAFATPYGGGAASAYDWGNFPFALSHVTVSDPLVLSHTGTATNRPKSAAVNRLTDGSFETSLGGFSAASVLKSVADATAPEGSKSLLFDTTSTTKAEWYILWVDVEKDTDYVFSAWLKGARLSASNQGYATLGVVDPSTNRFIPYTVKKPFYTQSHQLVPTAWDNQWHLRSVVFNSGDRTRVGIALYGCAAKMWVDGMALYENGEGVGYEGENMSQSVSYRFDAEYTYCAAGDSLLRNPTFDGKDTSFWQSGSGWNSGFLSIAKNDYEYGTSLKYTATKQAVGQQYIRWVEVQPNTWYTFSVDVKILKDGDGRLILLDGKLRNPSEIMAVGFDAYSFGNDWFTTNLRLYTGCFTRLGIAVADGGGAALMDNLRLFKSSDGIPGDDTFRDPDTGSEVAPPTATVRPSGQVTAAPSDRPTATTLAEGTTTSADGTAETTDTVTSATAGDTDAPAEDTDATPEPGADNGFPWLYVGVGGGAAVLIAGGVVLFLFLRKKKSTPPTE